MGNQTRTKPARERGIHEGWGIALIARGRGLPACPLPFGHITRPSFTPRTKSDRQAAMHGTITIPAAMAFRLVDEVSRQRSLADDETDLLERLICRGHKTTGIRIQWTATLDQTLWHASQQQGGIGRFAMAHKITRRSAYCRLNKLRARRKEG